MPRGGLLVYGFETKQHTQHTWCWLLQLATY